MNNGNDKFPPVADIDESEPDLTSELSASDLEDLSDERDADALGNDTPPHIRDLNQNAPKVDESSIPTMMLNINGTRTRNLLLGVAAGLLGLVVVLFIYRSSLSMTETSNSVATVEDVTDDSVEGFTIVMDDDTTVTGAVQVVAKADAVSETDEVVNGYDSDKCAAPKTDRAWLECAAAAYAELRREQKQLSSRVSSMESQNTPSLGVPIWMKWVLGIQSGLIVVLLVTVFRKQKGSDPSTS